MSGEVRSECCDGAVLVKIGCPEWMNEATDKRKGRSRTVETNFYVCDNPGCPNHGEACDVQIG